MQSRIALIILLAAIPCASFGADPSVNLSFAAPIESFSHFAELAAAIAIAYAGLPSFRCRLRVQEHVREIVEDAVLIEPLIADMAGAKNLCAHACWGVLFRLGKLRGWKNVPEPIVTRAQDAENRFEVIEPDYNFQKRLDFRCYSAIFASNLDKRIALAFGAIASSVLWFGAIDKIYFVDPKYNDPARAVFLANLEEFYSINVFLILMVFILFVSLWRWDLESGSWRRKVITWTHWVAALIFVLTVILATFRELFYSSHFYYIMNSAYENISSETIGIILFVAILFPLALLIAAEYLVTTMNKEADRCVTVLKAQSGKGAQTATIASNG